MRRVSALLGVLALSATAASAADMSPPPPAPAPALTFAGWYVGGSVGWAQSRTSTTQSLFQPNCTGGGGGPGGGCALQLASVNSIAPSLKGNSGIGTLQGGFNWRFGYFVAGVEGDISYLELTPSAINSVRWVPAGGAKIVTSNQSLTADHIETLRGRIGFVPIESLLVYATGGLAFTDLLFTNATTVFSTAAGTQGVYTASSSQSRGSTVGGGFEWAWTREWTVRVDYQHLRFNIQPVTAPDSSNSGFPLLGSALTTTISKTTMDIIRVGVNRYF